MSEIVIQSPTDPRALTDRAYPRSLAAALIAVIEAAGDEKALCQQISNDTGVWPESVVLVARDAVGSPAGMAILVRGDERLVAAVAPDSGPALVEALIEAVVRRVRAAGRRPRSIEGTAELADALGVALAEADLIDPPSEPPVAQLLMTLRGLPHQPPAAPGSWRLAEEADLAAVRGLLLEGLGEHPNIDMIALVSILYRRAILWAVGDPVALLCCNYPVPFAQSVTNVVTLTGHRGRGLGSNLLYQVNRRWLASVRDGLSMLFVVEGGPATRFYERIGYRVEAPWRIARYRPASAVSAPNPRDPGTAV